MASLIIHNYTTSYFKSVEAPKNIPFPQYYDVVMDWKFPLTVAAIYAIVITLLNPKPQSTSLNKNINSYNVSRVVAKSKGLKASNIKQSGQFMTAIVFIHNLILCLYSLITFVSMGSTFVNNFYDHRNNLMDAYCDRDGSLWEEGLGYWGYLFYLSKYYEIIDTIIILMKGRRSSFLQTYHHAGAIITMWSGINYKAPPIWIFVIFNSFIHTIMYSYYAITSIGYTPPGKQYLTRMQITQFLIGTPLAISYLFVNNCLITPETKLATYINVSYLLPLTYLFVDFAKKTYGGSHRKQQNIKKID